MKAKAPAEAGTHATGDSIQRDPDTPPVIEEIRSYQRTARRIVRDPSLSFIQASMAILRLIQEARKAEAPELAVTAVWAEGKGCVTTGDRPMDREAIVEALARTDPVDLAQRRLLRDGYVQCPRCCRPLPDERALNHQARLTRKALEEALIREEAV